MADSDEIARLRVALGRQLATWREAAKKSQRSLADQLPFSRSTVANVETGRQAAPREFWERCDDLLSARGTLLAGCDQLAGAIEHRARAEAQQSYVRQAAVHRTGPTLNGDLESPTQILTRRATLHTSNLTAELLTDLEQVVVDVVERYETGKARWCWRRKLSGRASSLTNC